MKKRKEQRRTKGKMKKDKGNKALVHELQLLPSRNFFDEKRSKSKMTNFDTSSFFLTSFLSKIAKRDTEKSKIGLVRNVTYILVGNAGCCRVVGHIAAGLLAFRLVQKRKKERKRKRSFISQQEKESERRKGKRKNEKRKKENFTEIPKLESPL